MSEVNLNEGVTVVVEDAEVITTPIDDTLTVSGDAADAKAVGDALALKADRSELSAQVSVNGQSADQQGLIIVTGEDINVSTSDTTKMNTKFAALDAKTAEDIKMSSDSSAQTIAQAIADGLSVTADEIPMEEGETTTVADEISRLDSEKGKVKTVNGRTPSTSGNVQVEEVAYARNLVSDTGRAGVGTFIERMSGNGASVSDGTAYLQQMRGNMSHTGLVEEVLELHVDAEESGITASIDRDTFIAGDPATGDIELEYTTDWSEDPATYGVTVTGSAQNGDTITIHYVKEDLGTITPATPSAFTATGWNLYKHANGYAHVLKYDYPYHVGGDYTSLTYSATPSGTQYAVTVTDGSFDVPADGYVHVTGGNSTTTYITPEWQDWSDGPDGSWAAYSESVIDISGLFGSGNLFEYGLMAVGTTYDVIDFETGIATSRIGRMANTAANMATARASGRAWDADTDYIYYVKAPADITTEELEATGQFTASDHGIEWIDDTAVPVTCFTLYGSNLKNKLERDVVTISSQTLSTEQKSQARQNIGAVGASDVSAKNLGWYGVVAKKTLTSSYVSYETTSNRKLSDYTFLLFEFFSGDWMSGGAVVLNSDFSTATGLSYKSKYSSVDVEFAMKYVDDTHVQMKVTTTSTATFYARVIGMTTPTITV